jgi:2,3-bisphosphoglycerate-independent phosphoglycerate mutase
MDLHFIKKLIKPNDKKIVLLVMDGLGGLPEGLGGLSELETANPPNLNDLCKASVCGLQQPVGPGITPGSGAGHLALFGYDPIQYQVGRGVLAALGVNFDLCDTDVAARGNFCTVDEQGRVIDRRAGRIATEKNKELCELLRQIELPETEFFVRTVKDYRIALVLRGDRLSAAINDTDPQTVGQKPQKLRPHSPEAHKTSELVQKFLAQAAEKLTGQHPANMLIMRGFGRRPDWPQMKDVFGLKAAAIAGYPMYRGLAKLIGMEILETGSTPDEEFEIMEKKWNDFDFFYLHMKQIDSAGEDGDYDRKVSLIREVDEFIPRLLDLAPDVLVVTGDHSTPSALESHSWHPVPFFLWSKYCRPDKVDSFGERACMNGGFGPNFPAVNIMPLALANARRLEKFGP